MKVATRNSAKRKAVRRDEGFALLSVIWIAALLGLVATLFSSAVRSSIRSARTSVASAEAEALADAGVNLAIFDLTRAKLDRPLRFSSRGTTCTMPSGERIEIRVRDEAGKVDLNIASSELLLALFTGLGSPPEQASARAQAVEDFRDSDDDRRAAGAEREAYAAASPARIIKNAPFEAIEELGQVFGLADSDVERLRPYVTIYSGQNGIDPDRAETDLIDVLRRGARASAFEIDTEDRNAKAIPVWMRVASAQRAYSVAADVSTDRGARFVREAVVSRVALLPSGERQPLASRRAGRQRQVDGYRIWSWKRGPIFAGSTAGENVAGEVPNC